MSVILRAYDIADGEGVAKEARTLVDQMNAGVRGRLNQMVQSLYGLTTDGHLPSGGSRWSQFDALTVRLGQALREYFPDLADEDDETAWKRLAVAYAYEPNWREAL